MLPLSRIVIESKYDKDVKHLARHQTTLTFTINISFSHPHLHQSDKDTESTRNKPHNFLGIEPTPP